LPIKKRSSIRASYEKGIKKRRSSTYVNVGSIQSSKIGTPSIEHYHESVFSPIFGSTCLDASVCSASETIKLDHRPNRPNKQWNGQWPCGFECDRSVRISWYPICCSSSWGSSFRCSPAILGKLDHQWNFLRESMSLVRNIQRRDH
jgi:hypothetical protein